mgnify:FL=1
MLADLSVNPFWTTIEPYICTLTEEHLQWLIPKDIKDDPVFSIPRLGRHYTETWMLEDACDPAELAYSSSPLTTRRSKTLSGHFEYVCTHSLTQPRMLPNSRCPPL